MSGTLRAPDRRQRSRPDATASNDRQSPGTRFARRTIGFWLGGALLAIGGCILGVCMPYQHPVALGLSALWWGIYLGCFGASVGALIGSLAERAPTRPPRGPAVSLHIKKSPLCPPVSSSPEPDRARNSAISV